MVSKSKVRSFVEQMVVKFNPDKVVLFGSYAAGRATSGSDIDLFVIMDTRLDTIKQEVLIKKALPRDFPLDLIVIKPAQLTKRIKLGDTFVTSVLEKGKILYEKNN